MTDSMIERVARTIAPFLQPLLYDQLPAHRKAVTPRAEWGKAEVDEVARAAIEALRDPTPEMRNAGHQAIRGMGDVAAGYKVMPCWQSMLDVALETLQKPAESELQTGETEREQA